MDKMRHAGNDFVMVDLIHFTQDHKINENTWLKQEGRTPQTGDRAYPPCEDDPKAESAVGGSVVW
jgi:hypothetical protein